MNTAIVFKPAYHAVSGTQGSRRREQRSTTDVRPATGYEHLVRQLPWPRTWQRIRTSDNETVADGMRRRTVVEQTGSRFSGNNCMIAHSNLSK